MNFIHAALEKDVLNDPQKAALKAIEENDVSRRTLDYLKIANADQFNFYSNSKFMTSVTEYANTINTHGIDKALEGFLESKSAA